MSINPTPDPGRAPTILIAEEDRITRAFLADQFAADGYTVLTAEDSAQALAHLAAGSVAAVVTDVNGSTLGLLDAVRHTDSRVDATVPIIALTAHTGLHRVRLLERGADDVLGKPFSYVELRARLANLLRRAKPGGPAHSIIRVGPITIDTRQRLVLIEQTPLTLTPKEYDLLVALASDPARVFTESELKKAVWGFEPKGRGLHQLCARLRRKLAPAGEPLIQNVWSVGYRLRP